ncbi:Holliday junction resolvase RuvX [Mycoplasma phocimorsus]|uniref:Putative pre-16S rRNA nuclease n=1 Tax=Mycoplasma phocimorsus TaxID=3045839 RepID=A0AAJ1PSG4_9MOLU|nr:Holliday junction resolvase RuvX [Mycoplasma phocimorsus]MDJ1645991.1 Holliday junction resolvase RuvX [Mycoplasma phocimorsus]MDJ1646271.1 Holliday junction resolvase RuvX [Mycoplasma phocimorsus]MDJ1646875.1 Holliday junction resolvase RuvX [Mycoplasma phocimorsus]MDJ1647842.1 Holliday junction resolvase RuvX [Mycoplasma phocimorsus]MDJ1648596.1 Holliday junction resolvase RuvX [Mycoplasma phocimorsus]
MRKIALDIGTISCGIAISDPYNMFASSLETIYAKPMNFEILKKNLLHILKCFQVDTIIVGYPKKMNGNKSETTFLIEEYYYLLKNNFSQKIVLVDERQSTKQAREIMRQGNLTRKKQKNFKDSLAAQIILERYLQGGDEIELNQ